MNASSLNKPSSQEGLKPCPFCGGTDSEDNACQSAKVTTAPFKSAIGKTAYRVECACGAVGPSDLVWVKARSAWNTRHPSFNDAIEAAAVVAEEPMCGIEINRFIASGSALTDHKGNELFIAKDDVDKILQTKAAAVRSLKLPDYRGGEKIDSTKTAESEHSPSTLNTGTE